MITWFIPFLYSCLCLSIQWKMDNFSCENSIIWWRFNWRRQRQTFDCFSRNSISDEPDESPAWTVHCPWFNFYNIDWKRNCFDAATQTCFHIYNNIFRINSSYFGKEFLRKCRARGTFAWAKFYLKKLISDVKISHEVIICRVLSGRALNTLPTDRLLIWRSVEPIYPTEPYPNAQIRSAVCFAHITG